MIKAVFAVCLTWVLLVPADASEIAAPEVLESGRLLMPQNTESFGDGLLELLQNCIQYLRPDLREVSVSCGIIVFSAMLISVLSMISRRMNAMVSVAGAASVATVMFRQTNSMVVLAVDTVKDILEYGKLLCQIMTAALAAQGGTTSSSALYIGTTVFVAILNTLLSGLMVPAFLCYLVFTVAHGTFCDEFMKKSAEAIKNVWIWLLKLLIIAFTTYMGVTGAVSGTTDMAALKAAKIVISSAVPVVGGILSDSSEAVLVGMGIVKNAAGIYGILAVLAVFMGPFVKIGTQYLIIKTAAVLCGVFGEKRISSLVDGFSTAMSLLLALIAAACTLILISTVCFLKGAG